MDNLKRVRNTMILFGFNFLLAGTTYIYEMVVEFANNSICPGQSVMQYVSEKHGVKVKSMSRCVRWAIDNATKRGKYITIDITINKLVKKIYNEACRIKFVNCK